MTMNLRILIIILMLIGISSSGLNAQNESIESSSAYSVEVDPIVPLVLNGIGGHFWWKPKS